MKRWFFLFLAGLLAHGKYTTKRSRAVDKLIQRADELAERRRAFHLGMPFSDYISWKSLLLDQLRQIKKAAG